MEPIKRRLQTISVEYNMVFGNNDIENVKKFQLDGIAFDENITNWFADCDPCQFTIPWIVEDLELFRFDTLIDRQIGYRWSMSMEKNDVWDSHWLVIGQSSGDPVFFNSQTKKIYGALHGTGSWQPVLLAENMKEFILLLYCWLTSLSKYDYGVYNQDYMIKKELLQEFKRRIVKFKLNTVLVDNLLKLA